ncbi:ABC transporter transmembrane domain-containing protein [Clostridium thermosuccinogenes]|uniref:ABC transporter transmembrane domain-containing protein n=1 Tax=Clostridium thermosuccinogenes TaxID=84032 RepID=UPI00137483C9|nr:ABC transporter ATP-binding protein [Pseudoclostridium thermosuccinogenes]
MLIKLLYKRIGLITPTIIISIFAILASLWWNAQLSTIINTINAHNFVSIRTIIIAAIAIFINMGLAYSLNMCSGWTCETLAHDLRMGYAKYFTALSLAEIENLNAGEQLSRLQNEIGDVSGFLGANLFTIVNDLIKFIGTFSWMLWLNPKLTLLANIPTAIIMWYTVYSSKVIGKATYRSQQANAQMNNFADTLITIFPVLRLFDANLLLQEKYNTALEQWESASISQESKRAKLMSLSALLSCIPLLLLFLIGGTQIIRGTTTIGTLYIFINLSGNVSGVMMNMPGRIAMFRGFSANMKRIEPFVSIEKRPAN